MVERIEEPAMHLTRHDDSEFEATRDNTSLFTFLGRTALDHIFVHTDDNEEGVSIGTYIFSSHHMYEKMEEYMVENDYPLHLNLREVAECDQNAWENMVHQQALDIDTVPEDWL